MTWTPKTKQAETWTAETPGLHVFSTLIFSHALLGGLRVFDMGEASVEVWDAVTAQAETWTPA